jgi:hypothetical protein
VMLRCGVAEFGGRDAGLQCPPSQKPVASIIAVSAFNRRESTRIREAPRARLELTERCPKMPVASARAVRPTEAARDNSLELPRSSV